MQYRNGPDDCQLEMLAQVYEPLLRLWLPELCRRCGAAGSSGFCPACTADFRRNEASCVICGRGPLAAGRLECATHPADWRVAGTIAPLVYAPPLEHYLHALKYGGERAIGRCLGQLLAEAVHSRAGAIDAIVAVPLHPQRLLERGYNQALEIARPVAAALRAPIVRAGIDRSRATAPQTSLHGAQRHRNLSAAFTVTRELDGRRIAVLDDVITTGATINAMAGALRRAGAAHVEAWALARTQAPGFDTS